jgi:hypothetical protein
MHIFVQAVCGPGIVGPECYSGRREIEHHQ